MKAALERLAVLKARGFAFLHIYDSEGRLDRIVGVHPRAGCIDAVQVYSEQEAVAWRAVDDGDAIRPDSVLWSVSGSVAEVIEALLELPPPDHRTAPRLERRAPTDLWLPGSR